MSMYGEETRRPTIVCDPEKDRTKQEFKDECDIQTIVSRFQQTGQISHLAQGAAQYVDVSGISDYRSAIETVTRAQEYFNRLPAKVRSHFKNDAAEFVDALGDAERRDELLELGLLERTRSEESAAVGEQPEPEPEEEPPEGAEGA